MEQTVGVGLGDCVVHQLQAGVAAHEHLLRTAAQDLGEEPLGSGQAAHLTVVADVDAVGDVVLRILHQMEDVGHHVQLLLAGLAPGHVQLEALGLELFKAAQDPGVFLFPLLCGHLGISGHKIHPFHARLGTQFPFSIPAFPQTCNPLSPPVPAGKAEALRLSDGGLVR